MKLRTVGIAALFLSLPACNSTERQAQEAIRETLKDPDSAQFRRFEVKGNKACLEVNAKNSFGGYVGFRTAFLERDKDGKWDGYADSSGLLDFDYCLKDLDKA